MDENSNVKTGGSKGWIVAVVVVAILAAAGAAYWYMEKMNGTGETDNEEANQTAIVVDGNEIDQATLNRSIERITNSYATQGVDTTSAEASAAIKEQAVTALVNRQLMINAATEAGVSATNEEIEAEFQNAVTNIGGTENLAAALGGIGMDEADLKADIAKDVMINKYLEEKLNLGDITVTDEEVQTAYDTASESNTEEVPPLEEVADLIKNQLLIEKQQQLIGAELERLRAEAEIEVLV